MRDLGVVCTCSKKWFQLSPRFALLVSYPHWQPESVLRNFSSFAVVAAAAATSTNLALKFILELTLAYWHYYRHKSSTIVLMDTPPRPLHPRPATTSSQMFYTPWRQETELLSVIDLTPVIVIAGRAGRAWPCTCVGYKAPPLWMHWALCAWINTNDQKQSAQAPDYSAQIIKMYSHACSLQTLVHSRAHARTVNPASRMINDIASYVQNI